MSESVSSEFKGQGGIIENSNFKDQIISSDINEKIEKLRQSCDNFWVHNQQETICDCTIANNNIFVPWKIKVDETTNFKDQIMKSSELEVNENCKEMPRTICSNVNRKSKNCVKAAITFGYTTSKR